MGEIGIKCDKCDETVLTLTISASSNFVLEKLESHKCKSKIRINATSCKTLVSFRELVHKFSYADMSTDTLIFEVCGKLCENAIALTRLDFCASTRKVQTLDGVSVEVVERVSKSRVKELLDEHIDTCDSGTNLRNYLKKELNIK